MGNSKKKLVGLTILMTLLTVVIVFSAVIFLNNYSKVRLLNQFILELPKILQDREEELDSRKPVFEEDALARGELGVWIYKEESGLSAGEEALAKMPELYGSLKVEETGNITQKGCTVRFSYTCAEVVREDVTKRLQEFMEESFRQDA